MNKYCPNCRDEFRPELETCPDCSVALVAGPRPDVDAHAAEHAIELVRTRDRLTLHRLVGLLEEAGIAYELGEDLVLSAIVGDLAQPVRVMVLERDAMQAREIVRAIESAELEEGAQPEGGNGGRPPEAITPE